jgi:hypothetical protein
MGHPQPKTPVNCDNATLIGIVNNTIKHQCLQSMEIKIFWIGGKTAQEMYALKWHPGQENMADYQSKHHMGSHHVAVQPWYLHMQNSPQLLPWAKRPSALKGCVGTLKDRYIRKVPLPQAPQIQHASHVVTETWDTCYLAQVLRIPMWSDLTRKLADLGWRVLLLFSLSLV